MSREIGQPLPWWGKLVAGGFLIVALGALVYVLMNQPTNAYSKPVSCTVEIPNATVNGLPAILTGTEDTDETGRRVCLIEPIN